MFGFFKKKIKNTVKNITKKIEEEPEQEIQKTEQEIQEPQQETQEKPEIKKEPKKEQTIEKTHEKKIEEPEQEKKGKFGFFKKITTTQTSEKKFEDIFWELEVALLENNTAVEVIDKIKEDLKKQIVNVPLQRGKVEKIIQETLKKSIEDTIIDQKIDLVKEIKNKKEKPYIIAFVGINGSGKTTTIAKVAHMLKQNNITSIIAASDTFRAAAIDQIQQHADKIGIKLIKQDYGADPAAVAYDAIKHAKSTKTDTVLIDTAGRLHSNKNLLEEMKKIIRISKPDLKIFVGESITGNDCTEQAKNFNKTIDIDGIILSKMDIDEKGGTAISVSYITKKPIIYIGTGQEYKDIELFNKNKIMETIGL